MASKNTIAFESTKRPLMIKEGICLILASAGFIFIGMWLYYGYFAM
ncbi:MAG: hypothetical protein J6X36_02480 [Lachnospiraceae bacterium]|nr:hypothetical protein [Lachnospiraceae bacterium]